MNLKGKKKAILAREIFDSVCRQAIELLLMLVDGDGGSGGDKFCKLRPASDERLLILRKTPASGR